MTRFINLCRITSCKKRQFCFDVISSFSHIHSDIYNVIFGRMLIGGKRPRAPEYQKSLQETKENTTLPDLMRNNCSKQNLQTTFVWSFYTVVSFVTEPLISLFLNNSVVDTIRVSTGKKKHQNKKVLSQLNESLYDFVTAVENRVHDASLTAMDDVVISRFKMVVRSITGSSRQGPDSVVQHPDQRDFPKKKENTPLMTASSRVDLTIDQDKNDRLVVLKTSRTVIFRHWDLIMTGNRTLITEPSVNEATLYNVLALNFQDDDRQAEISSNSSHDCTGSLLVHPTNATVAVNISFYATTHYLENQFHFLFWI